MRTWAVLTVLVLTACGGAPALSPDARAPHAPTPPAAASPTPPPASASGKPLRPEDLLASLEEARDHDPVRPEPPSLSLDGWQRAAKVKGVAAPPAACAAFAKRAGAPAKDVPSALAEIDPAKRDAMLATLQSKDDGVRVLRADLAPIECADALLDGWLSQRAAVSGRVGQAAIGLSLASKLARTAGPPPSMNGVRDKARVLEFVKGPLKAWLVEQATAIDVISQAAAALRGYGGGVAAVEAGSADLRLVDGVRAAPTPAGWDAELKNVYEAALDEAFEPRKRRGRDAAIYGLVSLATEGCLRDARVDRARAMIGKLYGGRRVDALDALLLPKWEPPAPTTTAARALAQVPVFWGERASWAPPDVAAQGPALARGVPEAMRAAYRAGSGPKELRGAYARARFDLGRMGWRRTDFVEAANAAHAEGDELLVALSLTLARVMGQDHSAMKAYLDGQQLPGASFESTELLDVLADRGNGMAAFDAAHLRALGVPEGKDAGAWFRDVAARFRKAASLLSEPEHAKLAADRAAEADATAAAAAGKK